MWKAKGEHGGGDPVMVDLLLGPEGAPADRWNRLADLRAGAWSILTGIAANRSMTKGGPVVVADLIDGLDVPPDLRPAA